MRQNPCRKCCNHSNCYEWGIVKCQVSELGIFGRDREHPYQLAVGGRDVQYPCRKCQDVNNGQGAASQEREVVQGIGLSKSGVKLHIRGADGRGEKNITLSETKNPRTRNTNNERLNNVSLYSSNFSFFT